MQVSRIAVVAIAALGIFTAGLVPAQEKAKERAPVIKVLLENDKVRVTQSTFKPGDVSTAKRVARVNYIIKGGTFERTSPEGKKSRYERKAGTAVWLDGDSDTVVNVGKTTIVLVSVANK